MLHLRMLMNLFAMLFLSSAGESAGNGQDGNDDQPGTPTPRIPAEYQAEVNRIAAAEARKAAKRAREDRDAELKAEREAAEAEAERQRNEAKGEYEKARTALEQERDSAKSSLGDVTAERDRLLELVKADVDAAWNDLPEEVRAAYAGADDDALAKKDHMQRMKPIIDRLTNVKPHGSGNRQDPPPAGGEQFDRDAEVEKARRRVGRI